MKWENIPIVDLHHARDAKRYRSLGDKDITSTVDSNASAIDEMIAERETTDVAERSGRSMDYEFEDALERLRVGVYM
jgi:sulfate adenylyltransferase subunit 2